MHKQRTTKIFEAKTCITVLSVLSVYCMIYLIFSIRNTTIVEVCCDTYLLTRRRSTQRQTNNTVL
jgi:hypothetical protein